MNTTIKTSAARIQVGDVIDFDQHKGAFQRYDDRSSLPGKEDQASGLVTVVAVKRVVTSHPGAYKKTTAIAITFDNGRSMEATGVAKFPVVIAEPVEAPEVEAPAVEAPAAVETAEAAEAELARRKHNKLVKKTGEGVRIEAASEWAFKASTEELRSLAA